MFPSTTHSQIELYNSYFQDLPPFDVTPPQYYLYTLAVTDRLSSQDSNEHA